MEPVAIIAPADIGRAVAADPHDRQGRCPGAERDILRARHHRHDKGVVILGKGQGPAVRRDMIAGHQPARGMLAPVIARQVDADQPLLIFLADAEKDAVAIGTEMRIGPGGGDAACRSPDAGTR